MWGSYPKALTLLVIFASGVRAQNETEQKQNRSDSVDDGAVVPRNFSANFTVSDVEITQNARPLNSTEFGGGSSANLVQFNTPSARGSAPGDRTNKLKDFRPSPPVSTQIHYEFNHFPVRPAYPEAKTNPSYARTPSEELFKGLDQRRSTVKGSNNDRVIVDSPPTWNPISTRVKFPDPNDNQDSYVFATKFNQEVPPTVKQSGREFNFNQLVEVPKKYHPYPPYDKTLDTYNIMERPSYYQQVGKSQGSSSWKKILKLLATFIPIGLLISALTPTVITVTNVNDTGMTQSSRYRSADSPKKQLHNHLLSSLEYFDQLNENGCEFRVFCELLVTASQMPDSEKHVKNLLDNFANQEVDYKSRAEELRKVFEAVGQQDCDPISCNDPDNT